MAEPCQSPVWDITSPAAHSRTGSNAFLCLGVQAFMGIKKKKIKRDFKIKPMLSAGCLL